MTDPLAALQVALEPFDDAQTVFDDVTITSAGTTSGVIEMGSEGFWGLLISVESTPSNGTEGATISIFPVADGTNADTAAHGSPVAFPATTGTIRKTVHVADIPFKAIKLRMAADDVTTDWANTTVRVRRLRYGSKNPFESHAMPEWSVVPIPWGADAAAALGNVIATWEDTKSLITGAGMLTEFGLFEDLYGDVRSFLIPYHGFHRLNLQISNAELSESYYFDRLTTLLGTYGDRIKYLCLAVEANLDKGDGVYVTTAASLALLRRAHAQVKSVNPKIITYASIDFHTATVVDDNLATCVANLSFLDAFGVMDYVSAAGENITDLIRKRYQAIRDLTDKPIILSEFESIRPWTARPDRGRPCISSTRP